MISSSGFLYKGAKIPVDADPPLPNEFNKTTDF